MDKGGSGYSEAGKDVEKTKTVLFSWTAKDCAVKGRMVAASSFAAIKGVCRGVVDCPISDKADLSFNDISKQLKCS